MREEFYKSQCQEREDGDGFMEIYENSAELVADYWLSIIEQRERALVERIEEMKKLPHERDWDQANLDEGYNMALDDVIKLISHL